MFKRSDKCGIREPTGWGVTSHHRSLQQICCCMLYNYGFAGCGGDGGAHGGAGRGVPNIGGNIFCL